MFTSKLRSCLLRRTRLFSVQPRFISFGKDGLIEPHGGVIKRFYVI